MEPIPFECSEESAKHIFTDDKLPPIIKEGAEFSGAEMIKTSQDEWVVNRYVATVDLDVESVGHSITEPGAPSRQYMIRPA